MNMTFEEILKQEGNNLTDTERKAFQVLGTNSEFKIVAQAMENYIQRLNANLLVGTETEKGSSAEELYKLRHFVYYWRKFISLTKSDDTKL